MTKIQKIKIILVACLLSLVAGPALAAEVSFDTKTQEVKANQSFEVGVFINTDNESINALEGQIVFPVDLLEPKEIRDGNSIVNFWIERPKIESDKIHFSGITPGGYLGKKGLIFSVIFEAQKEGRGFIGFQDVKALLNDGQGTPTEIKISNFQFNIKDVGRPYISDVRHQEIEDKESPETFQPEIAKDAEIFDGKYFLVFATQDKGSGIDYYEIKESRQKFLKIFKKWVIAESPYVLKDRKLRSYVYIKAVDKAGNERIAVVEPRYPIKWYENYWIWIIIILAIIFSFIVIKGNLWKKQ